MRLMKRVARKVTLSLSEAKRFTVLNDIPFGVGSGTTTGRWRYKNLFAQLPTATGSAAGSSYGIDGSEIVDLLWKCKITFQINFGQILAGTGSSVNAYGTTFLHVYLVGANDYSSAVAQGGTPPGTLTWSDYPAQFSADDPGWFLTQNFNRPTLNGNNLKVIRAWHRKYTPEVQFDRMAPTDTGVDGRGVVQCRMDIKHKFKGKKTFEDAPLADTDANYLRAGTLRGWNYFLLMAWGTPAATVAADQPIVTLDQFMIFTPVYVRTGELFKHHWNKGVNKK